MSIDPEDEIGSDFVGYRIEGLIGRGGMGVVYRAYDLRLKRTVALKLVAPELVPDEHFRTRFARESELAMSLEHPNVVPIYDAGEVDGRLYLAMRYVEGTDLRTLLRAEGALKPPRALAIARQIGNALNAAHARGLVHRDVKPSNVLLDRDEHVYLADFGLTRRFEKQGPAAGDGRSLGTLAYLAPEQISRAPVDWRADVYSLGCVLYECLTGQPPYSARSRLAMAWAHLEEEPPRASEHNTELPTAIDGVIRMAIAKSTEERYPTCAALIAEAERALGVREPPVIRDLTQMAREGRFDPVIGRVDQIEKTIEILCARIKKHPLLIGEPGVGKTAIVEEIARLMATGQVPEPLADKRLITLDLPALTGASVSRDEFRRRLQIMVKGISRRRDIILFIDEFRAPEGTGATEGQIEVALLTPVLMRGELGTIAVTSPREYEDMRVHDPNLERRFEPVLVPEPTAEETIEMLHGLKERYERFHRVRITDEAIVAAVELADRYIEGFRPSKAIVLIDRASSHFHLRAKARDDRTRGPRPRQRERRVIAEDVAGILSREIGAPVE